MTASNVQITLGRRPILQQLDWYFASVGQGMNTARLRRERLPEIVALEAMSDQDLALIGLGRDDILPHVFADLLSPPG